MSGYNYQSDSDDDFDTPDNSGGGMRSQLEKLLAQNKELNEKLSKFETNERQKTVNGLLKDKGLDPAVAELIPQDADAAVWLDEKAHLFGIQRQVDGNTEEPTAPEVQTPPDDDDALRLERASQKRMQEAQEAGASPQDQALLERMENISTEADLVKFFEQNSTPIAD